MLIPIRSFPARRSSKLRVTIPSSDSVCGRIMQLTQTPWPAPGLPGQIVLAGPDPACLACTPRYAHAFSGEKDPPATPAVHHPPRFSPSHESLI